MESLKQECENQKATIAQLQAELAEAKANVRLELGFKSGGCTTDRL